MTVRDRRRIEGAAESAKTSKGERYAEEEICSVVWFRQPEEINDSLTSILRLGAGQLLTHAVAMETEEFLVNKIPWRD